MHDFPKSSKMDASVLRKIKKPLIEKKRRDRINHCLDQLKSILLENVKKKIKKPLIEKKRRDRINHCLDQLKSILLENVKKKDTQVSRLDKADILEMTVKHLQQLQKQGISYTMVCDDTIGREYKSGYEQCTRETNNYFNSADGIRHDTKSRLGNHLSSCVGQINDELSSLQYSRRNSPFHTPLSVPDNYSYHTPITVSIPSSIQLPSTTPRRLDCDGTLLMPVPSHPIIKKETLYSPYYPPPESTSGTCATPIYYPPLEAASNTCATPTEDPLLDKSSGYSSLYGQSFQGLDSSMCRDSLDNSVNNNSLTCDNVWRPW